MKLFPKLLLLTALVGMIPLVIGGFLLTNINKGALDTNIRERRVEKAQYRGRLIENYLNGAKRNITTIIYERDDLAELPPAEVQELFDYTLKRYDFVCILTFVGQDMKRVVEAVAVDKVPPGAGDLQTYYQFVPTELVTQLTYSEVHSSSTGETRVAIAFPYFGKGMVVAELSLRPVQAIVQDVELGARGYAFLVDGRGLMVAHQDPARALAREDFSRSPGIAQALALGLTGTGEFVDEEKGQILESHQPVAGPGWMLFLQEPGEDAFTASRKMRNVTLLLIVGALILALAGGMFIARTILKPVYRLLDGTKEVGSGDLTTRVPRTTSDEIGDLSSAFNDMTASLASREEQMSRIDDTAKSLLSIVELKTLLDRTVESVQGIINERRMVIYMAEGQSLVVRRQLGWEDGESCPQTWPMRMERGVLARARATGGAIFINEVSQDEAYREFHEPFWEDSRNLMCVPMATEDRTFGVLCLHERTDGESFTENDRRYVEIIASAATASISNMQFLKEMIEKARMEGELNTAEVVQRNLFPKRDLKTPGLDLAGYFQSASETGGDWFGYLPHPTTGCVTVLIGDVTGHGVSAALVTATAHSFFQTLEVLQKESNGKVRDDLFAPGTILELLNKVLCSAGEGRMTMSFFAATFDPETETMTFANGGHTMPYLVRHDPSLPASQRLTVLASQGARLGVDASAKFDESSMTLKPGDTVFWYTDGVIESADPSGKQYDRKRLRRLLSGLGSKPLDEVRETVARELETFRGGRPLDDDLTFVVGRVPARVGARRVRSGVVLVTEEAHKALEPAEQSLMERSISLRTIRDAEEAKSVAEDAGAIAWVGAVHADSPEPFSALDNILEARAGLPCGVFINEPIDAYLSDVAVRGRPLHFFGKNGSINGRHTAALLRAMIDGTSVTLKDLVNDPAAITEWKVHDSRDRNRLIEEVLGMAGASKEGRHPREMIRQVLSELLTNSFYHAPRDASGEALYSKQSRQVPIILDPRRTNRLSVAIEGESLLLSVKDSYGSLDKATVLAHLRWSQDLPKQKVNFDERRPGAGLGMSIAYRRSRKMIVSIEEGVSTEIICEISLEQVRERSRICIPSLHLFFKELEK